MGKSFLGSKGFKAYLGGKSIKEMYLGNIRIYPNSVKVNYFVDIGNSYIEEVEIGESVLSPTTFTPTKSGWEFVGWREDTLADGNVLSSKIMEGEVITLYAVFKQVITLSYNGNGATGGSTASQSNTRYYNNSNIRNPEFTLSANGFSRTNYNFVNWRMGSASGTGYSVGSKVTLSSNTTFYASWTIAVTTIPGSSISLNKISEWSGNGNGNSGSSATISGNKITIYFTSTSYRTHRVITYSGGWNISGFTKCAITVTASSDNLGEDSIVGIGSSAGSYNLGSYSFNRDELSQGTKTFTFNLSPSSTGYLYFKYNESVNYNYDRDFTTSMQIDKIVFS